MCLFKSEDNLTAVIIHIMASTTQLSCSSSYGIPDVQNLTDTVCMYIAEPPGWLYLFIYEYFIIHLVYCEPV